MPGLKRGLFAAVLLLNVGLLAGCAAENSFTATSQFQGREVRLHGELYRPDGPGPFPAVVLLHGCSGIKENQRQWAGLLRDWGYVAYLLDSLGPRGLETICNKRVLSVETRAQDAYDAKAYLASLPIVRAGRIGVMGWSHGGSTVLCAANPAQGPRGDSFRAYVALYPGCRRPMTGVRGPLLMLVGGRDEWTPALPCQRLAKELAGRNSYPVLIKTYPQATHAYDYDQAPRHYHGHLLEYDPAATRDSREMVRQFLTKYLAGS